MLKGDVVCHQLVSWRLLVVRLPCSVNSSVILGLEPLFALICHKDHVLMTQDGKANVPGFYQTVKSIEQQWETAVGARGLCFLLAFGWMQALGVDPMQAIVSTSSAAWVMAFWKQALFCSGHHGSRVGCHGTASPFSLTGGEGGGAAGGGGEGGGRKLSPPLLCVISRRQVTLQRLLT